MKHLLTPLALLLVSTAANAQIGFEGDGGFDINSNRTHVLMGADVIANYGDPGVSWSTHFDITLTAWMLNDPYTGWGYVVAEHTLGDLPGGFAYFDFEIEKPILIVPEDDRYCSVLQVSSRVFSSAPLEVRDSIDGPCEAFVPEASFMSSLAAGVLGISMAGRRRRGGFVSFFRTRDSEAGAGCSPAFSGQRKEHCKEHRQCRDVSIP